MRWMVPAIPHESTKTVAHRSIFCHRTQRDLCVLSFCEKRFIYNLSTLSTWHPAQSLHLLGTRRAQRQIEDTLITIKISFDNWTKRLKLPLKELGADTPLIKHRSFFVELRRELWLTLLQLRHFFYIALDQTMIFERSSDPAAGHRVIDLDEARRRLYRPLGHKSHLPHFSVVSSAWSQRGREVLGETSVRLIRESAISSSCDHLLNAATSTITSISASLWQDHVTEVLTHLQHLGVRHRYSCRQVVKIQSPLTPRAKPFRTIYVVVPILKIPSVKVEIQTSAFAFHPSSFCAHPSRELSNIPSIINSTTNIQHPSSSTTMADHQNEGGPSKKRTHAAMIGAKETDVVQEDAQVARPQAALTSTHSDHTVAERDLLIPDQPDVLPATTQPADDDLAAITEDHDDDMNVDEVDRGVVGEPIPEKGESIDVTGAGGDEVADAEDDGEKGNEVGEGNEDGQEAADEEDSINYPVAQHTANATVVPGRARQPGEWTPELRAMARRELRSVRRRIEREDRQAAVEWGTMLFAHAAAVSDRERRDMISEQTDADEESEDEEQDA
ncbi:hypothetical protein M436DRAFT_67785 [Aureobasidium namibiae CBS 147.97]|uniref:Uncharacterized protein n=1 Tax=Aureobasidium namibiae CBS 147.97 TaxID=1043004 RepID=A0A074X2J5_9PEZI